MLTAESWELHSALSCCLLLVSYRTGTAGWALAAVTELANVDLQLRNRSAQCVAVHAEFARGTALVPLIFLQHRQNELLLEFAHGFRIKDVAAVHLHDECFELISHGISLSARRIACLKSCQL